LIDPATRALDKKIVEHNVAVQAILLTHAHFDHILEVDFFAKKYDVPVYIHENEKKKLFNIRVYLIKFQMIYPSHPVHLPSPTVPNKIYKNYYQLRSIGLNHKTRHNIECFLLLFRLYIN
jgi:glyoxylase-like metal-dependent hydrolase (beta-lactamase superfamily II)